MTSEWFRARVRDASDRDYSAVVLPLLKRARKEIILSFYLMEPNETASPAHPVNRLLESLLQARRRGVRVRIFLNTNFRFRPKNEVGRGSYFDRLLEAGAEITTLLPARRLHDKLMVIDRRCVVEGSTNWSISALEANLESSSVIESPAYARRKLARVERLTTPPRPKEPPPDRPLLPVPETAEIFLTLLEKGGLARMISSSDERAMDLYLILLGQAAALGKNELNLDLETLSRALKLPTEWARSRKRRQAIKVLRKLETRYRLIRAEFSYGRDALIRMKEFQGEKIGVPGRIFEAAYLADKSSPAVFLELAKEALKKEGVEIDSLSAASLERRFGIGKRTAIRSRSA